MSLRQMLAVAAMFAAGACADPPPNVTFDGARALEYAKLQVDAGPRIPGTDAHRLVGDRIVAEMRTNADTVIEQTWVHVTQKGDSLPLRNIFAQFNRAATKRILYVTHYDTRPTSDNAFSVDDRSKPVPGANDGASGVGMLIVLGEALKAAPSTVGVDFLFTDGEDYGAFNGVDADTTANSDVLIGANYYARNIIPTANYRPEFAVLWDMVGGRNPVFFRETYSEAAHRDLNDRVWGMAEALGFERVFSESQLMQVTDDHVPLLGKGFRIVDVIDMSYSEHHKPTDTIDKLSAETLTMVGRVALALIRAEEGK